MEDEANVCGYKPQFQNDGNNIKSVGCYASNISCLTDSPLSPVMFRYWANVIVPDSAIVMSFQPQIITKQMCFSLTPDFSPSTENIKIFFEFLFLAFLRLLDAI